MLHAEAVPQTREVKQSQMKIIYMITFVSRYPIPDKEHEIPGADINIDQDMEFISWALLNPHGEPFFVM